MKNAICLCLILCGLSFAKTPTDSTHWENYSQALAEAKRDHKMVFVDIVADWCLPCCEMDKTTYRDKGVATLLNTRFHPVRIKQNSQDTILCDTLRLPVERCFFDVWNLQAVPSYVLIAPNGLSILTYSKGLDADEMRMLLMQFLSKEKEWIAK